MKLIVGLALLFALSAVKAQDPADGWMAYVVGSVQMVYLEVCKLW